VLSPQLCKFNPDQHATAVPCIRSPLFCVFLIARACVCCFADAHSLCSAHVFDGDAEQVDVYTEAVDDLVRHFFLGYNGTVMAHGKRALA
jgi:hypothetical protein